MVSGFGFGTDASRPRGSSSTTEVRAPGDAVAPMLFLKRGDPCRVILSFPTNDDTFARGVVVCTFAIGPDFANGEGRGRDEVVAPLLLLLLFILLPPPRFPPDEGDYADEGKDEDDDMSKVYAST